MARKAVKAPATSRKAITRAGSRKAIKGRVTSRKAAKAQVNHSLFKALAPRMMRDLMRDFSPLADFEAAGVVGNGGGESGGFTQIQEKKPTVPGSKGPWVLSMDANGLCRKARQASCLRESPEGVRPRTRQVTTRITRC